MKIHLWHPNTRRKQHIIGTPQRRPKRITNPTPPTTTHTIRLPKHQRRISRIRRRDLRNILRHIEPQRGVVREQVQPHTEPALRVARRLRVEVDGVGVDDVVLGVDEAAGSEVDDVEVVDFVLLVGDPGRVGEGGCLELWWWRGRGCGVGGGGVPVCCHDILGEGVKLRNVLGDVPALRSPILIDVVIDFVAQLEQGHLVTQRVPDSSGLCLCIAPIAGVVGKVECVDDVCSRGEIVCKGSIPLRCNVTTPPFTSAFPLTASEESRLFPT